MAFLLNPSIRKRSTIDPFTDLLFNALLGFTFLFLVAVMFMNPQKKGIIDPKAEYIIAVTWADNNPNDIDTYLEDPTGAIVFFNNKEAGLVHLDRDDRGVVNDTLDINGKIIQNPLNQEVTTIRGTVAGEYVLNVHYYATQDNQPVDVTVKVDKVNPALEVIYYDTLRLQKLEDERTALRFTIGADGRISNINHIEKRLYEKTIRRG